MITNIELLEDHRTRGHHYYEVYDFSLYSPNPLKQCYSTGSTYDLLQGASGYTETFYVCGNTIPHGIPFSTWRITTVFENQIRFYYLIETSAFICPVYVTIYFTDTNTSETYFLLKGITKFHSFYECRDLRTFTTAQIKIFSQLTRLDKELALRDSIYLDCLLTETNHSDLFQRFRQVDDDRVLQLQYFIENTNRFSYYSPTEDHLILFDEERDRLLDTLTPRLNKYNVTDIDWFLTNSNKVHDIHYLERLITPLNMNYLLNTYTDNSPKINHLCENVHNVSVDTILLSQCADYIIEQGYIAFDYTKSKTETAQMYYWGPTIDNFVSEYTHCPFNDNSMTLLFEQYNLKKLCCTLNKDELVFTFEYSNGYTAKLIYNLVLHMLSSSNLVFLEHGTVIY